MPRYYKRSATTEGFSERRKPPRRNSTSQGIRGRYYPKHYPRGKPMGDDFSDYPSVKRKRSSIFPNGKPFGD